MDSRKILRIMRDFSGALVITAMFALAMGLTVWKLDSPEFAALFVALAGFAFVIWWDSYKEAKRKNRGKIAMLSYLRAELIQTRNTVKSITSIVGEKGERDFLPATLHNEAWQAAIAPVT